MSLTWFRTWQLQSGGALAPADNNEQGVKFELAPSVTTAFTNVSMDVQITTDADAAYYVTYIWIVADEDTITAARDTALTAGLDEWWQSFGAYVRFLEGHWISRHFIINGSNAAGTENVNIPCPTNVTLQASQRLGFIIKATNDSGGAKNLYYKCLLKYDFAQT